MKINKEGYGIIIRAIIFYVFLVIATFLIITLTDLSLWIVWIIAAALLVPLLLIIRFFRDPWRPQLKDSNIIYSPADGKVVVIEEVFEKEFFQDRMIQVSVFMSINNIHVNWLPLGGKVVYKKVHNGKYMVAWHPKSSEENERVTTVVESADGHRVMIRQVAGYVARRIVNYTDVGDTMEQNGRLGFIKFGSRLDVYLPLGTEILVSLNDKVKGSQTPLAHIKPIITTREY